MSITPTRYPSLDGAIFHLDAEDAIRHIALGKNVNQHYETGPGTYGTLLHILAGLGEVKQVELLLALGADPNARDASGETPLHAAASNGNATIASLLLGKRADPNLTEGRYGWTPLHMAAAKGHLEFVRALINGGADTKPKGRGGVTPLLLAANNKQLAVAVLLEASAPHRA